MQSNGNVVIRLGQRPGRTGSLGLTQGGAFKGSETPWAETPESHGGHWFGREALRQSPVGTFALRVSRELTLSLVVHSWHSQVKK